MRELRDTEYPRCLFLNEDYICCIKLHTYTDALEEAHVAATYRRLVYFYGTILVQLVKASIKITPTKTISVPKLGLDEALLGARQARVLLASLTSIVQARFFWTDSSMVWHWTRVTVGSYQMLVIHRIGEIQTLIEP